MLFLLGAALAYYFVFPFAWRFFASFQSPTGGGGVPIELLPRVSEYLDLVMKLIFAFGITFELPVLLTLLAKVGIVSSKGLKRYPPLCLCRDVRDRGDPGTARYHHADRPGPAADRALRNLHHCGEDGRAEAG